MKISYSNITNFTELLNYMAKITKWSVKKFIKISQPLNWVFLQFY